MVLQVILQGMSDQDIRARTLIQTAAGKLKKLSEVIEYIAAEETGIMQSKDMCHEYADVNGIRKSSYKQGERDNGFGDSRDDHRSQNGGAGGNGHKAKCGHCGEASHGNNSAREREKACKAWNKKCSRCRKLQHLADLQGLLLLPPQIQQQLQKRQPWQGF